MKISSMSSPKKSPKKGGTSREDLDTTVATG